MPEIDEMSQMLGRIEESQRNIQRNIDQILNQMTFADSQRREMATQLGHLPALQQTLSSISNRVVALEKQTAVYEKYRQRAIGIIAALSAIAAVVGSTAKTAIDWIMGVLPPSHH